MTKRPAPGKRKSTALMIRISQEQRLAFRRQAIKLGLSTSGWARMVLLKECKAQ